MIGKNSPTAGIMLSIQDEVGGALTVQPGPYGTVVIVVSDDDPNPLQISRGIFLDDDDRRALAAQLLKGLTS